MAGAPPPCTSPGTPPPGTNNIVVTWYRNWPILLDESVSQAYYAQLQQNIASAGGVIYSVKFYDASNNLIPGLDRCGNPIATPPPPPGGGGGSGGAPAGPDDDELTIGFAELMLELQTLINLIQQLTTSQPQPINYSQCCHAIVVALEALVKIVTKLEVTLSQPGAGRPPAVDLTAVVTELGCACTQLTAISQSSATVATDLAPGLKSIADAVANAKHTDVSQIVEQLKAIVREGDISQDFINWLATEGFLSPDVAQQLSGVDWSKALVGVFRTAGWTALTWFMAGVGYVWDGSKWAVGGDGNIASRLLSTAMHDAITVQDFLFLPTVENALVALQTLVTPTRVGSIGEQVVDPGAFLTRAISIIVDVFLVNYALHIGDVLPGQSMNALIQHLTGLLGLEEMRNVQIGPLIRHGPARVAEMRAKLFYRQEMPGISTLATFHARGLLSTGEYQGLEPLTGVPPQLAEATREAAFHGIPVFQLARIATTGILSDADLADEFSFSGMRPSSQHRYILAAAFLATDTERKKLIAALDKAYAAGLVSDNDFIAALDSAAHNTDRNDLALRTVKLEKQIALAHEYEAAYSREFLNGLLDAPSYQSALEALGMQPPDVAARMFRDESHLLVTQTLGAERAARAALRKTQAEAKKAAIEGFRTGTIDSAALSAALSLAGLTPAQTAAEVEYQVLASSGVLRWIYGRHLSPQDATLLRQQVQDLTRQREIQMLTDAQYVSQLQALSIPPRVIQALRAGANAHISPKTQAILTPPS